MAEENTITTIFRANIDQFSSSTQEMRRYMGQVNAEFAEATAGMGKWSDSTDGLSAKLRQLDGTLQAQKKQLSALEDEYNSLTDEQKQNTIQGQKLATAILKQRADVKKTESQIESYSGSLKELTDAGVKTRQELDDLNEKIADNGKEAESTAKKLAKGLGRGLATLGASVVGVAGSFLGLAESTREFRKEQAQLETAFDKAGFSAEQMKNHYAEFNAVLGDTKKTTETMQQLADFAKTEKELADYTNILTGVFATYGDALPTESLAEAINHTISLGAQVEGSLADAFEWAGVNVDDFNVQLEKCNSEEERSALISKKLNELYGEQAEHYKESNKELIEAEEAQTKLNQAMAELGEIAEPIATMMKGFGANILTAITPSVKLIGEGLKGAFEGASDGASKFAEGVSGVVSSVLKKITDALPTIINLVMSLVPALISSILNAIPQIVSALATGIGQIVGALGTMLPQILQTIIDVVPQIVQTIVDSLPMFLEGITQLVMGIVEALPSIVTNLLQALPQIVQAVIDGLNSFIPQLIQGAITMFLAIVEAIPVLVQALNDNLPKIITTIIDGLLSMIPTLIDGATQLLLAFLKALPTLLMALNKEIPNIVTTIVRVLTSRIGDIVQGAIQLLSGILEAIPQIIAELIAQMPTIISTMVSCLIDGIPDMIKAGADLLAGLFEGLLNPETIWNAVKSLFNGILGGIKKVFGIESPSKVFKNEIGKNLALGIGEGFEDEIGDVNRQMARSMAELTPTLGFEASQMPNMAFGGANPQWLDKLAELVAVKNQTINNNYKFDYTFEKMETSKLALHKATLETKRAIGG